MKLSTIKLSSIAPAPLLGALLAPLSGCGEPVVGSWEGDEKACGSHRNEFTLDGDSEALAGDGSFWFQAQDGSCIKCSGELSGSQKREGEYDLQVDFKGDQGCSELPDADVQCSLRSDDTELRCDIQIGNSGFSDTYNLVE